MLFAAVIALAASVSAVAIDSAPVLRGVMYHTGSAQYKAQQAKLEASQLQRRFGVGPAPSSTTPSISSTTPTDVPTGCPVFPTQAKGSLTYYGGPIIANVEVTPLAWGSGVTSISQITQFYKMYVAADDWTKYIAQYYTPSQNCLGNGSGNGYVTLSGFPTSKSLDNDKDIVPYLRKLVSAGTLKPNDNSYYPIHFAPGIAISLQGQGSCSVFCAYHNTIDISDISSTKYLFYGVIPDQGGSCAGGCGTGSAFANLCSVSSHELVEATTDPAIGVVTGNTVAAPAAWYNQQNGEIGDLCNGQQTTFKGSDGVTYTRQKEYSNNDGGCK